MTDVADFPDLREWIARLHQVLVACDIRFADKPAKDDGLLEFTEALDIYGKQTHAAAALGAVIVALEELPMFRDAEGLIALSALRAALFQQKEGGNAKLFQHAASRLLSSSDLRRLNASLPISKKVFQAIVVLCSYILQDSGLQPMTADSVVAQIFSSAGYTGRKSRPLSKASVYNWRLHIAPSGSDPRGWSLVERNLKSFRERPDWPPTLEDAKWQVKTWADSLSIRLMVW